MPFPPELWRMIINSLFDDYPNSDHASKDQSMHTCKPPWIDLDTLSKTCRLLRQVCLKRWFWRFCPFENEDVIYFEKSTNLKLSTIRDVHVRGLQTPARYLPLVPLGSLKNLKILRMDALPLRELDPSDMVPTDGFASPELDDAFSILSLSNPSTGIRLVEVDFHGVRWMDWPFLNIMSSCPALVSSLEVLRMTQDNIWCGLCNTCSGLSFQPDEHGKMIADLGYSDASGLPMMYTRLLGPLISLRQVYITVPISYHQPSSTYIHGAHLTFDEIASKLNWSGECSWCLQGIKTDATFVEEWVKKKKESAREWKKNHDQRDLMVNWKLIWEVNEVQYHFLGMPDLSEDDEPFEGWILDTDV